MKKKKAVTYCCSLVKEGRGIYNTLLPAGMMVRHCKLIYKAYAMPKANPVDARYIFLAKTPKDHNKKEW